MFCLLVKRAMLLLVLLCQFRWDVAFSQSGGVYDLESIYLIRVHISGVDPSGERVLRKLTEEDGSSFKVVSYFDNDRDSYLICSSDLEIIKSRCSDLEEKLTDCSFMGTNSSLFEFISFLTPLEDDNEWGSFLNYEGKKAIIRLVLGEDSIKKSVDIELPKRSSSSHLLRKYYTGVVRDTSINWVVLSRE